MKIEVWSDLVCPWCYIGFVRLDKALEQIGQSDIQVIHRAYQLDRLAAAEPGRTVEYLALAYGVDVDTAIAMMADVSDVAASEGLQYQLAETLTANTFLAHRLVAHAYEVGKGHELLMRLFKANFEEAKPIFSLTDLAPYAIEVGIDWEAAAELLAGDSYITNIASDRERAELVGVRGTPYFLIDEKVVVNGADTVTSLVAAIAKAREL